MIMPIVKLSERDARHIASQSEWHYTLRRKFSKYGFCDKLEDIPLAPLLIPANHLAAMQSKLRRLMALARSVAMVEFDRRSPIRQDQRVIVALYRDAVRAPIVGRPDCVLSQGTLKVLEFNIDSGMGGIQEVHELTNSYRSSALKYLIPVKLTSPLDVQIDFLHEMVLRSGQKSVAIVPMASFDRFNRDQSDRLTAEIRNRLSITAKAVLPDALRESEWLTDGQNDYGVFWRDVSYLHEPHHLQDMEQALKNARNTKTLVLSDPIDIGVDDKGALALISEQFDGPIGDNIEFADLKSLVPWTRLLDRSTTTVHGREINLAQYIRTNRHRLVLKKCASRIGQQVFIGSQTEAAIWDDIITRSKIMSPDGEDWVVQEFIPSDKFPLWYLTEEGTPVLRHLGGTVGPYIFGEGPSGWLVRVQGINTADDAVLGMPTEGNMGATTIGAVQSGQIRT